MFNSFGMKKNNNRPLFQKNEWAKLYFKKIWFEVYSNKMFGINALISWYLYLTLE